MRDPREYEPEDERATERLWSIRDVSTFLGLSPRTVRRLIAYQGLPCLRIGGAVRFDPASVTSWARRQRKEA